VIGYPAAHDGNIQAVIKLASFFIVDRCFPLNAAALIVLANATDGVQQGAPNPRTVKAFADENIFRVDAGGAAKG